MKFNELRNNMSEAGKGKKSGKDNKDRSYSFLKKNASFYDKVFSVLHGMVFVFDMNSLKMVWVNDAFRKTLGYENPAKQLSDSVFHPDDGEYLTEMVAYFDKNPDGTYTAIFKMRHASNDYVWIFSACNVFKRTKNNSVFHIAGVAIVLNNGISYFRNLNILTKEITQESNHNEISKLSRRELQLVKHFASGKNSREIAELVGLSFHTVNNHRKNILRKLGLKSIKALVNFAVVNGLN
jgi:DNA-binding CsgD family transcriptional regulator